MPNPEINNRLGNVGTKIFVTDRTLLVATVTQLIKQLTVETIMKICHIYVNLDKMEM